MEIYEDAEGEIDWNICVECGLCAQVCPAEAITTEGRNEASEPAYRWCRRSRHHQGLT